LFFWKYSSQLPAVPSTNGCSVPSAVHMANACVAVSPSIRGENQTKKSSSTVLPLATQIQHADTGKPRHGRLLDIITF